MHPDAMPASDTHPARFALAVADAGWFNTQNLFGAVTRPDIATLLLSCQDYRNAWRRGWRPWRPTQGLRQIGSRHWSQDCILPPGWMKRFPRIGMRPIADAIRSWRKQVAPGSRLALVMSYPHYIYLRDLIRPDLSIYYNIDDYTLYWPDHKDRVEALERQVVRESDLTICVAKCRADLLSASVPEAAARIRHVPHGAADFVLSDHVQHQPADPPEDLRNLPRPLLGYIGSLEDRIDWPLMTRVADAFPHASIVLIGRLAAASGAAWERECRRCLARPNVHLLGWRAQDQIGHYNEAFDICLIPYRADHPFNQACCPTKILDYLGGGRPVVSTDLPECRLYADLFPVTSTPDQFIAAIVEILEAGSDDGRCELRWHYARNHTCERIINPLLGGLLDQVKLVRPLVSV